LPNKNVFTDAIISVVGEYKALLKDSAKKGNKSDGIRGGITAEDKLQKILQSKGLDLAEMRKL
jgi:hypothetical protein|tara:strand:- start:3264 stop:3452 length:189 start_codon:yes stop_codon:yes gene_type:complete